MVTFLLFLLILFINIRLHFLNTSPISSFRWRPIFSHFFIVFPSISNKLLNTFKISLFPASLSLTPFNLLWIILITFFLILLLYFLLLLLFLSLHYWCFFPSWIHNVLHLPLLHFFLHFIHFSAWFLTASVSASGYKFVDLFQGFVCLVHLNVFSFACSLIILFWCLLKYFLILLVFLIFSFFGIFLLLSFFSFFRLWNWPLWFKLILLTISFNTLIYTRTTKTQLLLLNSRLLHRNPVMLTMRSLYRIIMNWCILVWQFRTRWSFHCFTGFYFLLSRVEGVLLLLRCWSYNLLFHML